MTNVTEDFVASYVLNEKLCFGKAWPLPRLTGAPTGGTETYEVVVVGAGPAGLLLTLELARLGLADTSLLCVDAKEEGTKAGHADGVNARSQEILRTLGLEGDLLRDGNALTQMTFWAQSEHESSKLERKSIQPFHFTPAVRFDQLKTLHQGRIEKIFKSDLKKYSENGVQYSTNVQEVWLDEDSDYPVVATLEHAGSTRTIRTNYLVGADGAHSIIRKSMDIEMEGDVTDIVWGVIDFIADTNFPDIRRASTIEGIGQGRGDALIVPRERCSDGSYITRLYVDMTEYDDTEILSTGIEKVAAEDVMSMKSAAKQRRAAITANAILAQGAKILRQYRFQIKSCTQPFWWAAYSVGQRLAKEYVVNVKGMPRIFLAGDACHTHSPRQGQGMNISMQDSHNLAWKLAYAVFGLTPNPAQLLQTYESERQPIASKVVFFDKRWNQSDVSREDKIREAKDQILGCGVEYDTSLVIGSKAADPEIQGNRYPVTGHAYIDGILRTGRRLLNVRVRRFADGTMWDIHDDLLANGRYRVIVICGDDFPDPKGRSLPAVASICGTVVKKYPRSLVEAVILQPEMMPTWEFDDLPKCVKDEAEMRLHCAPKDVYNVYGVNVRNGVLLLVRPDGIVSMIANLEDVGSLDRYLQQVLITI